MSLFRFGKLLRFLFLPLWLGRRFSLRELCLNPEHAQTAQISLHVRHCVTCANVPTENQVNGTGHFATFQFFKIWNFKNHNFEFSRLFVVVVRGKSTRLSAHKQYKQPGELKFVIFEIPIFEKFKSCKLSFHSPVGTLAHVAHA